MTVPEFETIDLTFEDSGVLLVRLNRPHEGNAVNGVMHDELLELLRLLQNWSEVGAVVVTGEGDGFCAGGSMSLFREIIEADWRQKAGKFEQASALVREFLAVRPPVVAAVNGPAMGLGATLALLSDIIVMAEDAVIADTHVKVGIVAGDGGTLLWPERIGMARAKEYLLTGDRVDAAAALQMGLVNRVVPVEEVLETAMEWGERFATGPRQAIACTKQAMNAMIQREAAQQMPLALALESRTMEQPDVAEGVQAFQERRDAVWPSSRNADATV